MKEFLFVLSAFVAVFFSFGWVLNDTLKKKCDVQSVSFSDHNYTFIGGCMVEHNGKWLPLDNIRGFD